MKLSFIQGIINIISGKKTLKDELLQKQFVRKMLGSCSQYGEDLVLAKFLEGTKKGFYIDIGAHHPTDLSNTQYFYKRGFRGINIEPNPDLVEEFYKQRPEDTNLNVGVSLNEGEMEFYVLEASTLSTFNKEAAYQSCEIYKSKITGQISVNTMTLKKIIEQYGKSKVIDFISVDAEGYDLAVLQSNDWQKYRPRFVMVEINQDSDNILEFMSENNYKILYNNGTNCIFKG